jgi:DNA-binding TFAR19-related protein (PDSD5 family)
MAMTNREKQAAYRKRNAGLIVKAVITPQAKEALDRLVAVEPTQSQGQVISEALIQFKDGKDENDTV